MQEIVIWGTGAIARQLYYRVSKEGYQVKYFVDNALIDSFYEQNVYRPTKDNCSKHLVVVASNTYYKEISVQLLEFGLEELRDFIPYQALGKKVVLLHGNCYKLWIEEYLKTSKTFMANFWIYSIPRIYYIKRGYINEQLLKHCDVFISQDVQENNKYDERLSFNYLAAQVNNKVICIPNVYGLGQFLYPQAILGRGKGEWSNPNGPEMENGLFMYSDENIDQLWLDGERRIDKIVEYLETDVYSKESIIENMEVCFEKWEKRDQLCDVKIMDYIRQEYKKELLFYEPANPCNNVLRKISEGILEILGIDKNEIQEIDERIATCELPIYKCVKDALGLEYEKKYVRQVPLWERCKLISEKMDLEEYCREYCYWCHDKIPENSKEI